jgi:hypothetical protein
VHGSGQCGVVQHQRGDRLEVKLPILCRLHARAVNLAVRAAVAARVAELIGD